MATRRRQRRRASEPPRQARVDKIVNDYLDKIVAHPRTEDDVLPGLAVAVRWNKRTVHMNCYGYANLETAQKITPETVFDLGSLSKQFTAAAAYTLVFQKRLDIHQPLSIFFPEFPAWAELITVEDLLHHTSALPEYIELYVKLKPREKGWYDKALTKPDHWYPTMPNRRRKEITNKQIMQWLADKRHLPPPDIEFGYSNSGYVVLAELVERVAEEPFAKFLMESVIFGTDAEMDSTYVFDDVYGFAPDDPQTANHARCYNRVGDRFVPVGYTPLNFITGDGNVHSTIRDLARWERFLHSLDYNLPARELLWSPVMIKNRKRVHYGAGWRLMRERYEDEIEENGELVTRKFENRAEYHRGEWLGWRSFIARASKWIVPKRGRSIDAKRAESLGIIVLSNADFGDKQFTTCRIAQEISKLYWGKFKKHNIMNNFNCD